jgi:hypothetical protein
LRDRQSHIPQDLFNQLWKERLIHLSESNVCFSPQTKFSIR